MVLMCADCVSTLYREHYGRPNVKETEGVSLFHIDASDCTYPTGHTKAVTLNAVGRIRTSRWTRYRKSYRAVALWLCFLSQSNNELVYQLVIYKTPWFMQIISMMMDECRSKRIRHKTELIKKDKWQSSMEQSCYINVIITHERLLKSSCVLHTEGI
jgi:hypothetical protein